jgi:tetratricopeptide (TPR) repeat protein
MPKRKVREISHSALTLHRIVRRSGQPYPEIAFRQTTPVLPDLVLMNGSPQDVPRLTLLQAYADLLERQPAYLPRYLQLLEEVRKTEPKHPFVLAALGRKALHESDPHALDYLREAVAAEAISPIPYQDLAEALARALREEEAIRVLQQGLERFPYSSALHKLLAARYIALKQYPAARQTITRYLEAFPEDSFMREMLRKFDAASYSNRDIRLR